MASAVEFILSLKDKMSGPARAAKSGLDGVKKSIDATNAASKTVTRATGLSERQLFRFGASSKAAGTVAGVLGRVLGTRAAVGFARVHTEASRVGAGLPSLGQMFSSLGSGAASLGPALLGIGASLLAVGAGGIGLVAAGAKYAAEMAGFKEQTLFAYKYILGSKSQADIMFREADALARIMGSSTTKTAESMRELMGGGFSQKQSVDITAAISDVAALSPTANVGAISAQLAQMKGAGRVLAEDLKPLLNAGLNDDIFYQVLREMTGKTDQKDLKKMLEQGKVSADQGIQAILETVNRMGGSKGLGSVAAARANETMGGQIDAAKGMFERLFMSISAGPASGAMGGLVKQVTAFLDPEGSSGKRLLAVFNSIASGATSVLASLQGGTLGSILNGLLAAFEKLQPIASGFFGGFSEGFGEAFRTVKIMFSAFSSGAGPSLDLVGIAKALGSAFGFFAVGLGSVIALLSAVVGGIGLAVFGIGAAIVDIVGAVAEFASEFGAAGLAIAVDFVKGLVDGITGGMVSVVGAVTSLGSSAIDGIKGVFQIQSPSRVMAEVGGYVADGFTQGVDGGAPAATAAVSNMVAPAALGSLGAAGGMGGTVSMGDIVINLTGVDTSNAAHVAEEVAARVEEQLRVILQRLAGEAGVAPAAV